MMKKSNKKGFTLVELIVVIAIMAILAAVLVPTVTSKIKDANDSATASDLSAMLSNISYEVAEGKDPLTIPTSTDDIKVAKATNANIFYFKVKFETADKAKSVTGNNSATKGDHYLTYNTDTGTQTWSTDAPSGVTF